MARDSTGQVLECKSQALGIFAMCAHAQRHYFHPRMVLPSKIHLFRSLRTPRLMSDEVVINRLV
jgi:hypothetical protein